MTPPRVIACSIALILSIVLGVAAAYVWKRHAQFIRLENTLSKVATLDHAMREKICAHRCNNIPMYRDALRYFDCIEMDIHIQPPAGGPDAVYHPPAENNHGLTLQTLLNNERLPKRRLWLDVKDLSESNWGPFLDRLTHLIPSARRADVIVETVWSDLAVQPAAAAFRSKGFAFSYYVPTEEAMACGATQSQACDALRRQVLSTASMGFSHLSFDARTFPFVRSIRAELPPAMRLLTWDLTKAWPRTDLINAVDVYIINFPSPHADRHN